MRNILGQIAIFLMIPAPFLLAPVPIEWFVILAGCVVLGWVGCWARYERLAAFDARLLKQEARREI